MFFEYIGSSQFLGDLGYGLQGMLQDPVSMVLGVLVAGVAIYALVRLI
jgi:hypothetical protein